MEFFFIVYITFTNFNSCWIDRCTLTYIAGPIYLGGLFIKVFRDVWIVKNEFSWHNTYCASKVWNNKVLGNTDCGTVMRILPKKETEPYSSTHLECAQYGHTFFWLPQLDFGCLFPPLSCVRALVRCFLQEISGIIKSTCIVLVFKAS